MILEEWTTEVWRMEFFDKLVAKWNALCEACKPAVKATGRVFKAIGNAFVTIWKYIVKLRKIFLAVPVIWGAILLAMRNLKELPETVGILLQDDGTFSFQLARLPAALLPLVLTLACLFLMFISKRTLTPWLVSVFTLVIPIMLVLINTFPA